MRRRAGVTAFSCTDQVRRSARHRGERVEERGVDLQGWTLNEAVDISDDGAVVVGNGVHDGVPQAWLARLTNTGIGGQ